MYLNDIRQYDLLSDSEMTRLLIDAHSDNRIKQQSAIEKLVNHNQRFVVSVAKRWVNGDNLLDLINEGNIGLMKAIEKFDTNKSNKFTTYAVWWITAYIRSYIQQKQNIVAPSNTARISTYVSAIRRDFFNTQQRMPTLTEIQTILDEKYKFHVENLSDLEEPTVLSLNNRPNNEEEYIDFKEFTDCASDKSMENVCNKDDQKRTVDKLLGYLPKREHTIITKLFGIGVEKDTIENVAKDMKLSRERIRQLSIQALERMKRHGNRLHNIAGCNF